MFSIINSDSTNHMKRDRGIRRAKRDQSGKLLAMLWSLVSSPLLAKAWAVRTVGVNKRGPCTAKQRKAWKQHHNLSRFHQRRS